MEELSSNNVNTVENTELLVSEVPAVSIDPEVLPPAEIQNQVVLFDEFEPIEYEHIEYKPHDPEFMPKMLNISGNYPSIYTQTQNKTKYISEDLSNTANPVGQNQVVVFNDFNVLPATDNNGEVADSFNAIELKTIRNIVVSDNPPVNQLTNLSSQSISIPSAPTLRTAVRPPHE